MCTIKKGESERQLGGGLGELKAAGVYSRGCNLESELCVCACVCEYICFFVMVCGGHTVG